MGIYRQHCAEHLVISFDFRIQVNAVLVWGGEFSCVRDGSSMESKKMCSS